ncbi:MAG TPA: cupin domain-containing protein [Smithella sp.]|nr:cupin domain-containing protein [Smithella sp.]NMC96759.1 cupin domain-containing protein [Deltaproteobacteria bacterium]OQC51258.1 MAG: Cupin domain protein [Deltaproteobacteria bacterium ADurb.Bin022]HNQ65490.1 cupin domain-containing protein [Smithella sp.]HOE32407.1 cupin domain-containing protein [Smithella sp.]
MKKLIWVIPSVLFFLFAGCSAGLHSIETVQLAKTVRSWDGETLPQYLQGQPEVTILRIRIPAGSKLEMHHHPVINAGVLLKGELTVVADDNKTLHLRAGDSIVELVNKKHYGKNEGKEAAEIIVFYAGVENKPITVK